MLSVVVNNPFVSALALLALVDAAVLIVGLLEEAPWLIKADGGKKRKLRLIGVLHVLAWILLPPLWFFIEWYVIHPDLLPTAKWMAAAASISEEIARAKAEYERIKLGQDLAKGVWAAVLATVLFLVPKKS